ncbi:MAG: nucleoside triphosphate pyrophosphohydrolase [Bacteroidales bacterium]
MLNSLNDKKDAFARLIEVLDTLRVKCPWDAKQTNESLRPNTIEETYELVDAILADEPIEIKKELGDLLLHVLFYAKIADEKQQFDIADVCNAICDKLIYRHPHVFGSTEAKDAEQVSQNWEQLKLKEKGGNKTVLSGVPKSLPSLIKAFRIQEKAANVGFDWLNPDDVWAKVKEELAEVETEIIADNKVNMEDEFGDLLFSIINAARVYGINPENALERCNRKFISRFNHIEAEGKRAGKALTDMTLEEMDKLWNDAKTIERSK